MNIKVIFGLLSRTEDQIRSKVMDQMKKNEEKTQINGTLRMWGKCAHGEWTKTGSPINRLDGAQKEIDYGIERMPIYGSSLLLMVNYQN